MPAPPPPSCGGCGAVPVMLTAFVIFGFRRRNRRGQCDGPRLHEVDVRMTPQNAHRPLRQEAASAFLANSRGMAHRAEALSIHPALARSEVIIITRRSAVSTPTRVRRMFNGNGHAY